MFANYLLFEITDNLYTIEFGGGGRAQLFPPQFRVRWAVFSAHEGNLFWSVIL